MKTQRDLRCNNKIWSTRARNQSNLTKDSWTIAWRRQGSRSHVHNLVGNISAWINFFLQLLLFSFFWISSPMEANLDFCHSYSLESSGGARSSSLCCHFKFTMSYTHGFSNFIVFFFAICMLVYKEFSKILCGQYVSHNLAPPLLERRLITPFSSCAIFKMTLRHIPKRFIRPSPHIPHEKDTRYYFVSIFNYLNCISQTIYLYVKTFLDFWKTWLNLQQKRKKTIENGRMGVVARPRRSPYTTTWCHCVLFLKKKTYMSARPIHPIQLVWRTPFSHTRENMDESGAETFRLFCGKTDTEWEYGNENGNLRSGNRNEFFLAEVEAKMERHFSANMEFMFCSCFACPN
jgi:hypothetical protein